MRVEHLLQSLQEATREEATDDTNWRKVITLVQAEFQEWSLAEACAWKMVVNIPNGGVKDFRGIGTVEVLWKAVSSIINQRMTSAIR